MPVFAGKEGTGFGIYINFLHIANLIVIPIFDHPDQKNDAAVKTLERLYPGCIIEPVNANQLAEREGLFNCASWNILKLNKI